MEIDSKPTSYTGEKAGLVGIIPIHGIESSFDLPWQDIFMPLNKGLTAIERAVYECAFAGCTSIWIVCNDDVAPMLKHRVGECVGDPVWQYRTFELNPDHKARQIPIYYVPLNPKDLKRRDSLSWSVIYGAMTYNKFSYQISKWLVPEKFYVTFPWGIYDPRFIREHRQLIRSCDRFLLSHNDETVKENKFLSFTFTPDDVQPMKRYIYHECTGQNREKLYDMKYSSRFFNLEKVFSHLPEADEVIKEVPWYYSMDTWEGYKEFMQSEHTFDVYRFTAKWSTTRMLKRILQDVDKD
jgi:hypothetical protein